MKPNRNLFRPFHDATVDQIENFMSATAQTLKAPRQQSLPLPVKLKSKHSTRGISAASLRPGMWLEEEMFLHMSVRVWVVQNSATLRKVEVEYECGSRDTWDWDSLENYRYLGQGRRRWWWPLLPELARKYISEFGRP